MSTPIIHEEDIDSLLLDPENPRLRRTSDAPLLEQADLLKEMIAWELDELIVSYVQSGFWKHEPLIVVRESRPQCSGLVVVEGNRRAAALKCLRMHIRGEKIPSRRIARIISENLGNRIIQEADPIFSAVPFVEYETRGEVDAYLGFRHVTGVKQWEPQEKATFMAHLIDLRGYGYAETAKLIGSTGEYVRRNYIAYYLLNKFEEQIEHDNALEALQKARDDFSVFFLSLREEGVRNYLSISLDMEPPQVRQGIADLDTDRVERFLIWMFGTQEQDAFIGESRNIKRFAEILKTPEALDYISNKPAPSFDLAYGMTKGAADDVVSGLKEAREMLRQVLGDLDLHKDDAEVREAAWPVISAAAEIAQRLAGEPLDKLRNLIG